MNTNEKITFAIGLAFLTFILTTCMGCASMNNINWNALNNLQPLAQDTPQTYSPQAKEERCTIEEVPTLSGQAIYKKRCQ